MQSEDCNKVLEPSMGVCVQACHGSLERSADWLFSHADDLEAAVASVNGAAASQTDAPAGVHLMFESL